MGYNGSWLCGFYSGYETKGSNKRFGLTYANLISSIIGRTISIGELIKYSMSRNDDTSLYEITSTFGAREMFYMLFGSDGSPKYKLCYEISDRFDNSPGVIRAYEEVPDNEHNLIKVPDKKYYKDVTEDMFNDVTSKCKSCISLVNLVGYENARNQQIIDAITNIQNIKDISSLWILAVIDAHVSNLIGRYSARVVDSLKVSAALKQMALSFNDCDTEKKVYCRYWKGHVEVYNTYEGELLASIEVPLLFRVQDLFVYNPINNSEIIPNVSVGKDFIEHFQYITEERSEEIEEYARKEIKRAEEEGNSVKISFYGSY